MQHIKLNILTATLISALSINAHADINVVTSVKPVHSLVSGVMKGVGKPDLIVQGSASPHTYSLKPSQAKKLEEADLVFWMGHELESFLEKPLEAIANNAKVVELIDTEGLKRIKMREGGGFDDHGHDDHDEYDDHKDHDEHDEHDDHKDHDEHDEHDDHKDHDEHEGHDDHGHCEFDVHVWLDPENAKVLVNEIKHVLIELDPSNSATYQENAEALIVKLDQLIADVSVKLASEKDKGFVVFHDAYQYFEERFGMRAVGSITVSPEVLPGANRIRELQEKIVELNAHCVFSEPQFEPKLVSTVIEGTQANTGVLDPLGASIQDGPELYFTLIHNMANSLYECLSLRG